MSDALYLCLSCSIACETCLDGNSCTECPAASTNRKALVDDFSCGCMDGFTEDSPPAKTCIKAPVSCESG